MLKIGKYRRPVVALALRLGRRCFGAGREVLRLAIASLFSRIVRTAAACQNRSGDRIVRVCAAEASPDRARFIGAKPMVISSCTIVTLVLSTCGKALFRIGSGNGKVVQEISKRRHGAPNCATCS